MIDIEFSMHVLHRRTDAEEWACDVFYKKSAMPCVPAVGSSVFFKGPDFDHSFVERISWFESHPDWMLVELDETHIEVPSDTSIHAMMQQFGFLTVSVLDDPQAPKQHLVRCPDCKKVHNVTNTAGRCCGRDIRGPDMIPVQKADQ